MRITHAQHILRTLLGLSGLNYRLRKLSAGRAKNISFLRKILPVLLLFTIPLLIGLLVMQSCFPVQARAWKTSVISGGMARWVERAGLRALLERETGSPSAACALSQSVKVSGCYFIGGSSKAIVSVEVSWSGAVNGDQIQVMFDEGSQTRVINPESFYSSDGGSPVAGPVVSPQLVSFEIAADSATHTIRSSLSGASTCTTSSYSFSAPAACTPNLCTSGELGGNVFYDYNGDGQRQTGESIGAAGVTVKAFDSGNTLVATATTDSDGRYEFSATNGNAISAQSYPLRLEFSNLPQSGYRTTTRIGPNNQSSVQFVTISQCNFDIGVIDERNYCQNNPLMVVPCYVNGDPLPSGTSGDGDALVAFPYDSSIGPGPVIHLASAREVGALWGVAYNRHTNRVFSSAFLRRHVGLGPMGLGGIYVTNLTTLTTAPFIDIAGDLGIDVGQSLVPSNSARGLSSNKTAPSNDTAVYSLVAKAGIGDIDLSEDSSTLWMVNLYDKKIYSIDISAYNNSGTLPTPANVSSSTIPDPGCANGQSRPFGLKVNRGKVYVGSVCDASSGSRSDLRASIFSYDPSGSTWSTELSFPLTYPKGSAFFPEYSGWYRWTDNFADIQAVMVADEVTYPVPFIADLEFDIDGSMIIGFGDRTSVQLGYVNYGPIPGSNFYLASFIGGDVLRAYYSNNTYHLENNGKVGPKTGTGTGNSQGPGFGEFYNDDFFCCHFETFQGGIALKPGSNQLSAVIMDPVSSPVILKAAGVRTLDNSTGATVNNFAVFADSDNSSNGLFGKGASLGDLELTCSRVNYLELGNRIWMDTNADGIQGPNEMPLSGVTVHLYRFGGADGITANSDDGVPIATARTDNNGNYRFTSVDVNNDGTADNDTDLNDSLGLVNGQGLLANTRYIIRLDRSQDYQSGGPLFGKTLTSADRDNGGYGNTGDLHDSDGENTNAFGIGGNNYPEIEVKHLAGATLTNGTGAFGQVDHTLDFGFVNMEMSLGNLVWKDLNSNGIREPEEPGVPGVTVNLFRDNGDQVFSFLLDTFVGVTSTNANGEYRFADLAPGNYFVQVSATNFDPSGPLFGCISTIPSTFANNDQDDDNNGANSTNPFMAPPISSLINLVPFSEPTSDGDNNNGNNTVDFGFLSPILSVVENSGTCIGSGTSIQVQSQIINAGASTQSDNPGPEFVIDLPPTLAAVTGTCQSQGGNGSCVVTSTSQIVWNGSLAKDARLTLTYWVQGTNQAAAGVDLCIPVTANFDADLNGTNETQISSETCIKADCTPTGPGIQTDPGCSVLIYPIYTSNPTDPAAQNTRINITNINPTIAQTAHMFFVDGSTCSISDSYVCLTANQTTSFVLSDLDPGTTGYLIVVAVDPATGCPINSNYLIGDEYVKFESGHAANLNAECIVALPGGLPACNQDSFTAQLRFDGISYSMLPRAVSLSNLSDRASGNDTMLILDSLNGNLWTGLDRLGAIFGIAFDDTETPASFSFNPGTCQFRSSISNSFPRTTPRIETLIPAGRSGWMKMWPQSDGAIIGAAITYNPSLSNSSGAFVQGHNLHKLTLTPAASMTIPVFPPAC